MNSSSYPALELYGWSTHDLPPGTEPARIIRHDGSALTAVTTSGVRALRNVPGLEPQPTVGDWLALDPLTDRIVGVLERSGVLMREAAHKQGPQTLAANVDVVLITCGIDRPIKPGRIHRSVTMAWDAGATPVIVLTKANARADDTAVDVPRLEFEHPGVTVLVTSALEGDGLDAVHAAIAGRTAVLLGESGAGKSTLTNALIGRADAATGDVRAGDAKGRHTTTSRQLHLLPPERGGGVIIDTPGIRSMGLVADPESVDASFVEIAELAARCRFGDCRHASEPGCAVTAALESGAIDEGRYRSWAQLQREAAAAARRADEHAYRRYGKQFSRAAKEGAARKGKR